MLQLERLFTIDIEVGEPISAGVDALGEARVIPFREGRFSGSGIEGRLLPGGTDWQVVRPDGVVEIRAHYMLETDRGERIEVISEGMRHAAPGVLEQLTRGETVAVDQYYFRTFIRLRTVVEELAHLSRRLCIGVGERTRDQVRIAVYAVP